MSLSFPSAVQARSRELGLSVPAKLVPSLERYYQLLARWNQRINLTALPLEGFPGETLDRLIFEPLAAADALGSSGRWFDVGSGGGSPAIPLRLARPRLDLTMVEPKGRKAAFLREAVRQLQLERVVVVGGRIEEVPASEPVLADIVTVRALRVEGTIAAALTAVLRRHGRLVIFGGTEAPGPEFQAIDQKQLPGGSLLRIFTRR